MKKYLLVIFFFNCFYLLSFSQNNEQKTRREIDSLRHILPSLQDSARVDCLNSIAYKYDDLDLNWSQTLDSIKLFAYQAHTEAIRMGYKKGLGYAELRLAEVESLRNDIYSDEHDKNDSSVLIAWEQHLNVAISVGTQLHDNIITGIAYFQLSSLAFAKNDPVQYQNYLEKAISYLVLVEKQTPEKYREYDYADCPGCQGNEIWLGNIYRNLGGFYRQKNEMVTAGIYMKKAIEYYGKTNDKDELGNAYFLLSYIAFRGYDSKTAIDVSKKAISLFHETGNSKAEIFAYTELCKMYEVLGDFENGVEYCKKSILLAETLAKNKPPGKKNDRTWGQAFFWMCRIYKIAGDYPTALDIIRRGHDYYPHPMDSVSQAYWSSEIGDVHRQMGNYDSAKYYLEPFATTTLDPNNFGKTALGYLYVDLKEYDKALQVITPFILYLKKINRIGPPTASSLMIAASSYLGKQNYPAALQDAREALVDLKLLKGKVLMIKSFKLLSDIFFKLRKTDSAYYYLNQYTELKDSLINRQFYFKLTNYKKEAEDANKESAISLLSKDNKIKNQQLKQQGLIKNFLLGGLLALLLIGLFVYRNLSLKRKNEKLLNEKVQSGLQQKASELEMQALRAQMNPHFIFNCLSSINRFILKNETEAASDYLTKFSRLIRMVLIHSQSSEILLKDEIDMLRLYLDMEQMRFKNSFDYNISFTNSIDSETIFIPPLLLQPFCENAIWHGLMHKEGHGYLEIKLSMPDNTLHCIITDDGIGRQRSAELKSRSGEMYKSAGLKITVERLALMNKENGLQTSYHAEDVLDSEGNVAGTRVILNIHCRDNTKEPVKESAK